MVHAEPYLLYTYLNSIGLYCKNSKILINEIKYIYTVKLNQVIVRTKGILSRPKNIQSGSNAYMHAFTTERNIFSRLGESSKLFADFVINYLNVVY